LFLNKKISVKQNIKTKLISALLWLIFTILLISVVLWPIYSNNINYQFYFNNILFIVVAVYFFRYIFRIKHTLIENKLLVKLIIMPLGIVMAIYTYMAMNDFIDYYQSFGIYKSLEKFDLDKQYFLGDYIQNQYLFFGVAALVSSIIIPIRMLISVFRVYNKGHE